MERQKIESQFKWTIDEMYPSESDLEKDIDRLVLKMNRERLAYEKVRLANEIDRMMAKKLELKHKLERIEIDIDI